jgi:hypothetical protein
LVILFFYPRNDKIKAFIFVRVCSFFEFKRQMLNQVRRDKFGSCDVSVRPRPETKQVLLVQVVA